MGGFGKIWHVALLAKIRQDLAGLTTRVAGLGTCLSQEGSADIDVAGAGENDEVVVVGALPAAKN